MNKLVILESPGKIKKVKQFLKEIDSSNNYIVKASVGHVRELDKINDYNMGIDLVNMDPIFKISDEKKQVVADLIEISKQVDQIILATDPDREGEAISWHLYQILKNYNKNFKRMRLNTITRQCVTSELNNLSEINQDYVNSALTRQILDKMVGYRISPIVKNMVGGNSAGRVQSAVLRILCDRQKKIDNFKQKKYYYLQDDVFEKTTFKNYIYDENAEEAENAEENENAEEAENYKFVINKIFDRDKIIELKNSLGSYYKIKKIEESNFEETDFSPFSTADLLKDSKINLKFSTKKTTLISQKLYEKGFITYIRTDSNNLDAETEQKLSNFIIFKYGHDKLDKLVKVRSKKSDQEGHPAITPTHFEWEPSNNNANFSELDQDEQKLYELIWQNTINSMYLKPSGIRKKVYLVNNDSIFYASFKTYLQQGYYEIDENLIMAEDKQFNFEVGDSLKVNDIKIVEETNKAPSKLNEVSLIEKLQRLEIGRPSTYKNAIEVNILRGYVILEQNKAESMTVNEKGLKVNDFLEKNFNSIINLEFTKQMEKDLDLIANKKIKDHRMFLYEFYNNLDYLTKNFVFDGEKCSKCKTGYLKDRISKKGSKFIGCSNYPECDYVDFEKLDFSNSKACEICISGFMIKRSYIDKKTKVEKSFMGCSNFPNCKNTDY